MYTWVLVADLVLLSLGQNKVGFSTTNPSPNAKSNIRKNSGSAELETRTGRLRFAERLFSPL